MQHLFQSIHRLDERVPPRTPSDDAAAVRLVLAMLQESTCEESKGPFEQFAQFCQKIAASRKRDWVFLSKGLVGNLDVHDWEGELCWTNGFLERLLPLIAEMKPARA
jgi:hypothetical protein